MKKSDIIFGIVVIGALLTGAVAFAQTGPVQGGSGSGLGGHWGAGPMGGAQGQGRMPGVFGTVSAVNGSTFAITSTGFGRNASTTNPTTYTVDASNATVRKNNATSTVSAIAVGDKIMVRGTVSGTSVTATSIIDGIPSNAAGGFGPGMMRGRGASSTTSTRPTPSFQGNGEPVIGGAVAAINGSTLTVTNKSNVTYTVDATSATVMKGNATSSLANVSVNDNVIVQGTVNGNSVTATSIIDQGAPRNASSSVNANGGDNGNSNGAPAPQGFVARMFGGIGSFFHNLFGFF